SGQDTASSSTLSGPSTFRVAPEILGEVWGGWGVWEGWEVPGPPDCPSSPSSPYFPHCLSGVRARPSPTAPEQPVEEAGGDRPLEGGDGVLPATGLPVEEAEIVSDGRIMGIHLRRLLHRLDGRLLLPRLRQRHGEELVVRGGGGRKRQVAADHLDRFLRLLL